MELAAQLLIYSLIGLVWFALLFIVVAIIFMIRGDM